MTLTENLGLFVVGLVVLVIGAEVLIRGAVNIARLFGVSPFIIGLTLVGFGTSAPELVVNVSAAINDVPGLAIGNVVGSNIANVGLILGVAALIQPLTAQGRVFTREVPIVLFLSGLLWGLAADNELSRVDAGIFLLGFLMMGVYLFRTGGEESASVKAEIGELGTGDAEIEKEAEGVPQPAADRPNGVVSGIFILVGLAGLVGGAHLMVESATAIARIWGVSEVIIGLTVVAIGTSLPELAATGAAAFRGQSDIAVGNVVGSNMFNILLVLGVTGMVKPLAVDEQVVAVDMPVMCGFAVLLFVVLIRGLSIKRSEGALLLACYAGFIGWQAYQSMK